MKRLGIIFLFFAASQSAWAIDWQSRLENRFMPLGTVINRSGSTISGMEDSALWSGVYLASQCFRGSESQSKQILDGIETLFEVTGMSGAMARFAFSPAAARSKGITGLNFDPNDSQRQEDGWRESKTKAGWNWWGKTSRDQYSGFFFGAQACLEHSSSASVKTRLRALVTEVVRALANNGWKIPSPISYGNQTLQNVDLEMKLAWALVGKRWTTDSSLESKMDQAIRDATQKLAGQTQISVIEIPGTGIRIDQPRVNNYVEYYAWNMRYLALYLIFRTAARSSTEYQVAKNYFDRFVWPYTWDHQNTQFTWIKRATLGLSGSRDAQALREARTSLSALEIKGARTNQKVDLSSRVGIDFQQDSLARQLEPLKYLGDLIKELSWLKRINSKMADRPLPLRVRPGVDYFWQHNPYIYVGGKSPADAEYPAVDLLLAKYMGQKYGF